MKKIIMLFAIWFASMSAAAAAVYVDGMGAYTGAGDAKNQFGFGFGAGLSITDNVNVLARGIMNSVTKNANDPNETRYYYNMIMGAVEYAYGFKEVPLLWTSSAGVGMGMVRVQLDIVDNEFSDNGICIAGWTGLTYVATQHVAPFIQVGYHKSFFNSDFKGENISGFQFLAGVRITLLGGNRAIGGGY